MQAYSVYTESTGFRFTFNENSVDYYSEIPSYLDLINTIKKIFSFGSDCKISLYYLDCDNEEVLIQSHEDFARVVNYHCKAANSERIPIKVYIEALQAQDRYAVLSKFYVEENVNVNENENVNVNAIDNIEMSKINIAVPNISDNEINERNIPTQILELKQEIKENTERIADMLIKMKRDIEATLDQKLMKIFQNPNADYHQMVPRPTFHLNAITRENSFQILDDSSYEELSNPQLIKAVQSLKIKKLLLCSFCSTKTASAMCYVCENMQICDECSDNHKHDFHPKIFPSKTKPQSVSYRVFEPNVEKHSMISKIFFRKKYSSLAVEIIPQIPKVFEIKALSPIFFPIEIVNKSDEIIKMGELLITARNVKVFWEKNELNPHDILQDFTCSMNCRLVAPEYNGVYEVEIICLHVEKNITAPVLKLTITVMKGVDFNTKKSSLKTVIKKFI